MYKASRMQDMMQIPKNTYFVTKFVLVYFGVASPRGGAMLRIALMSGGDPVHVNITEPEKRRTSRGTRKNAHGERCLAAGAVFQRANLAASRDFRIKISIHTSTSIQHMCL